MIYEISTIPNIAIPMDSHSIELSTFAHSQEFMHPRDTTVTVRDRRGDQISASCVGIMYFLYAFAASPAFMHADWLGRQLGGQQACSLNASKAVVLWRDSAFSTFANQFVVEPGRSSQSMGTKLERYPGKSGGMSEAQLLAQDIWSFGPSKCWLFGS